MIMSLELMKVLAQVNTLCCCGTVNSSRVGLPKDKKKGYAALNKFGNEVGACCCCSPSETYGRKWGDSNFQILTELPVPPQVAGVVGTF